MEVVYVPCSECGRRQRVNFDTDGRGHLVETLIPCGCATSRPATRPARAETPREPRAYHRGFFASTDPERRIAGLCQGCPAPVVGTIGRALHCADCRKSAARASGRRYVARNPEKVARARRKCYRQQRPERLSYERERYTNDPEFRAKKLAGQRARYRLRKT